jgi:hypothetical protein
MLCFVWEFTFLYLFILVFISPTVKAIRFSCTCTYCQCTCMKPTFPLALPLPTLLSHRFLKGRRPWCSCQSFLCIMAKHDQRFWSRLQLHTVWYPSCQFHALHACRQRWKPTLDWNHIWPDDIIHLVLVLWSGQSKAIVTLRIKARIQTFQIPAKYIPYHLVIKSQGYLWNVSCKYVPWWWNVSCKCHGDASFRR